MFTVDDGHITDFPNRVCNDDCLTSVNFTSLMVRNTLRKLKHSSSCGLDDIPNRFQETCNNRLHSSLSHFWCSFKSGQVPEDWHNAVVVPIHKKGVTNDPNNYRPISLTSTCCHVMMLFQVTCAEMADGFRPCGLALLLKYDYNIAENCSLCDRLLWRRHATKQSLASLRGYYQYTCVGGGGCEANNQTISRANGHRCVWSNHQVPWSNLTDQSMPEAEVRSIRWLIITAAPVERTGGFLQSMQ